MTISYGDIARTRRMELGLTQREVAERACVDRTTVNKFENDRHDMRLDVFLSILNALNLKVNIEEVEA